MVSWAFMQWMHVVAMTMTGMCGPRLETPDPSVATPEANSATLGECVSVETPWGATVARRAAGVVVVFAYANVHLELPQVTTKKPTWLPRRFALPRRPLFRSAPTSPRARTSSALLTSSPRESTTSSWRDGPRNLVEGGECACRCSLSVFSLSRVSPTAASKVWSQSVVLTAV